MKALPWMFAALLAILAAIGWLRPRKAVPAETVRDTLIVRDTLRDTVPRPVLVCFDHWDTLRVAVRTVDTLRVAVRTVDTLRDSVYIPVPIPIERKEYRTDDYRAIVSGYRPRLDLMEVYRKTRTVTVTKEPKRWGIGPTAGFGIPGGWYVGIGVSYDLWQW